MMMVHENLYVEEVQYGEGLAEVLSIIIRTSSREKRNIIVAYVPLKTNTLIPQLSQVSLLWEHKKTH